MAAFRYAADHGAQAIEFDVGWTSDGHSYVLHDDTLDRTTDCTGRLEDHTWRQVAACDAGSWYGSKWAGERVPSFVRVLAFARDRGLTVNPEVKPVAGRPLTARQAASYVAAVYQFGMGRRSVVSSVSSTVLAKIRQADSRHELRFALITDSTRSATVAEVSASGTVYMPDYRTLTPARVAAFHKAGIKLWVWPARTVSDYAAAYALHPDVIVADDPAALRRWLTKR